VVAVSLANVLLATLTELATQESTP
jgi:hypothetical protein